MKVRKHFIIKGSVQGVGFRYRACHAAEYFGVTGWVRNLYDGSVEMEAEGTPEDIQSMFEAIERGTFIHIDQIEEVEIPLQNGRTFESRYE